MSKKTVFWSGVATINLTAAIVMAVTFDLSEIVSQPAVVDPVSIPGLRGSEHFIETDQPFALPGPQTHALSYWA